MEELVTCKKVMAKALPGAPNVCYIDIQKIYFCDVLLGLA
jgi:hypothetical protein